MSRSTLTAARACWGRPSSQYTLVAPIPDNQAQPALAVSRILVSKVSSPSKMYRPEEKFRSELCVAHIRCRKRVHARQKNPDLNVVLHISNVESESTPVKKTNLNFVWHISDEESESTPVRKIQILTLCCTYQM